MIVKTILSAVAAAFGVLSAVPLTAATMFAAPDERDAVDIKVLADVFFNSTAIWARAGQTFRIDASGVADISALNGGFRTAPDGTILETPPANSGAFHFFKDYARPFGVDPLIGTKKLYAPVFAPGHLEGAPYGALVAGFSRNPNPSYFDDFPNGLNSQGFTFVGSAGTIRAPRGGGYLFLAVNDSNNTSDNSGSFNAHVSLVPELPPLALLGIGMLALVQVKRRRVV